MPTIDVYSATGKKSTKLNLSGEVFTAKPNLSLLAQAIRVYLSNQRQSQAKTKTRGEVAFSTRKIYRQKGTGRARHGAKSAPIFVHGGVAHGPTGEQNYHLSMSKKMKKAALRSALSQKFKDKEIIVIDDLGKIDGKTKELEKVIKGLETQAESKKNTLVLPGEMKNVSQAGRNLPYLKLLMARNLNAYQVLNCDLLIFPKESLKILEEKLKTN